MWYGRCGFVHVTVVVTVDATKTGESSSLRIPGLPSVAGDNLDLVSVHHVVVVHLEHHSSNDERPHIFQTSVGMQFALEGHSVAHVGSQSLGHDPVKDLDHLERQLWRDCTVSNQLIQCFCESSSYAWLVG